MVRRCGGATSSPSETQTAAAAEVEPPDIEDLLVTDENSALLVKPSPEAAHDEQTGPSAERPKTDELTPGQPGSE